MEERYGSATVSSNLRLDENRRGAVNLLIAAGVASRPDKDGFTKASRVLGGALERLLSEWNQVAKPRRIPIMSIKDWLEALPLVQVGERLGSPVMSRDKAGARAKRNAQQKASDAAYHAELVLLAQKLPSRVLVREILFALAVKWNCEAPDELVAGAIAYWLASKCQTCSGTGEVQAGDKVRTCGDCRGGTEAPVPGADAGRALLNFMDQSRVAWIGGFKSAYREIHKS
ncbi:MAG: hypothetical protein V4451_16105 [Pseudomonadota bacterium]